MLALTYVVGLCFHEAKSEALLDSPDFYLPLKCVLPVKCRDAGEEGMSTKDAKSLTVKISVHTINSMQGAHRCIHKVPVLCFGNFYD